MEREDRASGEFAVLGWGFLRRAGLAGLGLVVVMGGLVVASPHREISTRVRIGASPTRVWAALVDIADYPKWNPAMRLVGRLAPGAVIENIEGSGEDAMVFWPRVLVVRPGRELRWLGHYWVPGVFDAEHYFLLAADGDGTVFVQGERFHGVGVWLFDVRGLRPGFERLDAGLKGWVEGGR